MRIWITVVPGGESSPVNAFRKIPPGAGVGISCVLDATGRNGLVSPRASPLDHHAGLEYSDT